MTSLLRIAFGLLVAAQAAFAQDGAGLVGTWKLVSIEVRFQDGRPSVFRYGKNPFGYLIFTSQGRSIAVYEGEGRQPPKTDQDRAKLLTTMFATSATYRVEGDKLISKYDASWNPVLRGKERVNTFRIDGDGLEYRTPWSPAPNVAGAPMTSGVFTLVRVK